MQRQSVGSPSSKLLKDEHLCSQPHPEEPLPTQEEKQKQKEAVKLKKLKPKSASPETYIHIIPMLTLLCFLILYLSSHDPSLNDLAQFHTFFNPAEDSISEFVDIKKGDIMGIRSLKNLKQEPRLHRKFAHF